MKEILAEISGVISGLIVIGGFIIAIFKPIRKRFTNWIAQQAQTEKLTTVESALNQLREDMTSQNAQIMEQIAKQHDAIESINDAQLLSVRSQIREIYCRNYPNKTLTFREQRDIYDLYELYERRGGNGYITKLVAEVEDWTINNNL
ncbi:MAG: hypothetical protein PHX74_06860 [Candidatus Sumerlaeales bacterium]|nr:hypothetical protein [Candidatus Sumerlaeales bacterium]